MSAKIRTSRNLSQVVVQYDSGFQDGEVIETTPPILLRVTVTNKGASTLYALVFDAATLPGDGAVPTIAPIAVPTGTTVSVHFNESSGQGFTGLAMTAGLAWCASTTAGTKTVDSTASLWLSARYT